MRVVNLFALRATNPRELYGVRDPIGEENDSAIVSAAAASERVIAAWGNHGRLYNRSAAVRRLLAGFEVYALRVTATGEPAHPLYLPNDLTAAPLAELERAASGRRA